VASTDAAMHNGSISCDEIRAKPRWVVPEACGMIKLEDVQPNAAIRGILPDALVTVVSVQWFGSSTLSERRLALSLKVLPGGSSVLPA
jgi:hypothetical protein